MMQDMMNSYLEETLRILAEEAKDVAISMLDASGHVVKWNGAAEEIEGYRAEEIIGKHFSCLYPGEERESGKPDDLLRQAEKDGRVEVEEWYYRRDGSRFRAGVKITAIRDRYGSLTGFSNATRDITRHIGGKGESLSRLNRTLVTMTKCNGALVRAEDELELLRDICHIIVEDRGHRFAWVGYAQYDEKRSVLPVAHAGHEDGYLEEISVSWAETEEGMGPTGKSIRSGLPCYVRDMEQDPAFAAWRDEARKRGYRSSLAIPLISSGQTGTLNIYSSEPDAFNAEEIELMTQLANNLAFGIKALRTREKHRLASEALAESVEEYKKLAAARDQERNLLRALIESIPIPVFYKDTDGLYLGCNSAFETFTGLPRNRIVGKTVYELAPKHLADIYRDSDAALFSKPGVQTYETSIMHKNGTMHDVIFNKATYVDADGRVIGIVGAIMDITQHRKAEKERKLLEAQLHQAQKMEAIGQLAGGIAHDFNNILTAIIGYSEIILMRLEKESPLRHFVEQVMISAERASELTNGLLAFSRKQVLHTKPTDLCMVIQGLNNMLGRLLPEDIELSANVADGNIIVIADKGRIEQVLMNLVTNARDAMPRGGSLAIEVSRVVMNERFVHAHGLGEPGTYACISVSDTGYGMDEETRKRMFDPFFTTKEVGKGTGLGMAIIYGIIQQHNGYITVHSETEKGTTFRIYLPLFVEDVKAVDENRESEPPPGGTETVLLAEDEAAVRELHRTILEEAGYRVIEAVDGEDAFGKFAEHMAEVDIVATDVIMPKLDGKSLFDEIRKIRPDMKVLFMSGYSKEVIVERGILDDGFSYIAKPVKTSELLKMVRDMLDENIGKEI